MKTKDIKTITDAQRYVEGCINDFEAGISTKEETIKYLGEYTMRLMEIFKENSKKVPVNPLNDQSLEDINTIMWESYMIKSRDFGRIDGLKIMKVLTEWCKR